MLAKLRELTAKPQMQTKSLLRTGKYLLLGKEMDSGLVFKLFIYLIFITTAYIYLNPIIYMVSTMFKSFKDLTDPTVIWIPSSIYYGHLQNAFHSIKFSETFWISIALSLITAISHCVACAVAGYAFARLSFPLKKFWLGCLVVTLIMPAQVIIIPTIIFFTRMKQWAFFEALPIDFSYIFLVAPAIFGHGLKGALFVIIFRQFFMTQPKELEEAAKIDGANAFKIFYRVVFPLAKPAILVVFLFSFVWTWNDFYYPSMFLSSDNTMPLAVQMNYLSGAIAWLIEAGEMLEIEAEAVRMSAAFLVIFPPILLYLFAQRWFVESVERTGIVE
jgi:multiple sugar transport system permease protein